MGKKQRVELDNFQWFHWTLDSRDNEDMGTGGAQGREMFGQHRGNDSLQSQNILYIDSVKGLF